MGKVALLLVTVSMIGLGIMNSNSARRSFEIEAESSNYKDKVLAREIATSSLNVIVGRVSRDFAGKRGTWENVPYGDGTYTIVVTGPPEGPAEVTVTGEVNGQLHTVSAELSKDRDYILDALVLDGPMKKFEIKDGATISGMNKNLDGTDGSGPDVHAIRTNHYTGMTEVIDGMEKKDATSNVMGAGEEGDVVFGLGVIEYDELANAVLASGGDVRYEESKLKMKDNDHFGSPDHPVVVIVDGKVDMKDESYGYGILYVNGDLKMSNSARWEGLIVVNAEKPKVELKDDAVVVGSMVVRTVPDVKKGGGKDPGLPGGHIDVDVFNGVERTKEIYHQHKYDDAYNVTGVNLLTEGCKKDGGLCWSTLMAGKKAAWIEILNPLSSYGNYQFVASAGNTVDAVNLTGTTQGGLPATRFNAEGATQMTVDFLSICALKPTEPEMVQDDSADRDDSFAVKIYDDNGGSKGALAYEVVIYHHTKETFQCNPGTSDVIPTIGDVATGKEFEFKIKKQARIQYSAEALNRLSGLIEGVAPGSGRMSMSVHGSASSVDPNKHRNKGKSSDGNRDTDLN